MSQKTLLLMEPSVLAVTARVMRPVRNLGHPRGRQGPTVLAGHSYGGAVISGAATSVENVIGLVFASAFAPDEGESLGALGSRFPPPPGLPTPSPTRWALGGSTGGDPGQRRPGPPGGGGFTDPGGPPAWKTLSSWFLVSTQDRMINPDLLRFIARIGATTVEARSATPRRPPGRLHVRAAAVFRR
jgi:pimeloyl-ACP methyl ester carboxylesterase